MTNQGQYLTTLSQLEALLLSGNASNDGHHSDTQALAKLVGLLLDLLSQLTSGGQDDGVGTLVSIL